MELEQINTSLIANKKPIVIINNYIIDETNKEQIINKINDLNYQYIDLSLAMQLKIIETCDEIINNESLKLDNKEYKSPLIIPRVNSSYSDNKTSIKNILDITLYLLKTKLLNLSKDTPIIILNDEDVSNDNITYISIESFLKLNVKCLDDNIYNLSMFDVEKTTISSIIPTYIDIMKYKINYQEEIDETTITLKSKKHSINFMFISNIETLNLEGVKDMNVIIEGEYNPTSKSVLSNEKLNDIYRIIEKPGVYFREA